MIYTIKKGKHRAKPLRLGLYFRQSFTWRVTFTPSAIYDLGEYQLDIQKLVGIRYLFKDNSARFGWRYNPAKPGGVEIMAYVHDNGAVTKSESEVRVGFLRFGEIGRISLKVEKDHYWFSMNGIDKKLKKTHMQTVSFAQGLYFEGGSNIPAPHDIKVKLVG